jgi:hypothetical protein
MSTESKAQIHRWRAFAVLAVSFFRTIVDLTIVKVALPSEGSVSPSALLVRGGDDTNQHQNLRRTTQ